MRSDAELARAFQDGDEGAFSILYDRYKRALFIFGAKMLGDGEAARDLVQDVFLKLLQNRSRMEHPERFRAWLYTVARNHCISNMRKGRHHFPLESAPEDEMAAQPGRSEIEDEESARLIRAALAAVKSEYREVLVLREYENLSYREIAEIAGTTEDAVKSRLFKARKALHEAMKESVAGER